MCFFFFKQKTAYEMRISDWSSDVCSSDLVNPNRLADRLDEHQTLDDANRIRVSSTVGLHERLDTNVRKTGGDRMPERQTVLANQPQHHAPVRMRSEEHTSELQSLMRISYAVFCLKKKKHKQRANIQTYRVTTPTRDK